MSTSSTEKIDKPLADRKPVSAGKKADLLRGVVFYYRLFARHLGKRIHLYAGLCLIGSLAESLAITSFVPLLSVSTEGEAAEPGRIEIFFNSTLNFFGFPEGFTGLLILMGIFGLIRVAVNFLQLTCRSWLTTGLERDLRDSLCKLIEKADYQYIAGQTVGYFNNLFSVEITRNVGSLNKLSEVISGMIFAGTYLSAAMLIDWRLTMVTGLIGLVGLLVLRRPAQRIQSLSKKSSAVNARMQSLVLQYLGFFKYLKATGTASQVRSRVSEQFNRLRDLFFQSLLTSELVRLATQVTLLLSVVGILYFMVQVRGLEVAAVLVVVMLFYKALQQIMVVQEKWQIFCAVSGSVDVVSDATRALADAAEPSPSGVPGPFSDAIELRDVSFRYDEKLILKNIDLRIEKNKTVGIVGESGAGKSTLVDLLTGVLSPTGGSIEFDGVPYSKLAPQALRSQFGYVLQEPVVFSDTIHANISLWSEEPPGDDSRLIRAARMGHAAEFIDTMEEGYDTQVGERGTRLSGGQRQRLAIARELYKDAAIIIFDEATSALDSASEAVVQEGIAALSGERTIVIIAHRLSTLRHCDVIVLLDAGEVCESGAWDELIASDGAFAEMCRKQGLTASI